MQKARETIPDRFPQRLPGDVSQDRYNYMIVIHES